MGLENSISEMIERQDSLSDKADAAEGRFDNFLAETAPGLQAVMGLDPNQCGIDSNGDGSPDGWTMYTNGGFTTWELAESYGPVVGGVDPVAAGSLGEEFVNSIPGQNKGRRQYRNHGVNIWRYRWDTSAGGAPASLTFWNRSGIPYNGAAALFVKEETPGVLDHRVWNAAIQRGDNDWAIVYTGAAPRGIGQIGDYTHLVLNLDTASIGDVGSILIAAPQIINCRYDIPNVGWHIWPGLSRTVDGSGDYRNILKHATDAWEDKV